jgi:hypothetical protein
MRIRAPFFDFSSGTKLLVFLFVIIFFYVISSFAGLVAGKLFLHMDWADLAGIMSHPENKNSVEFLYLIQVVSSLGVFILAPLFFVYLTENSTSRFLQVRVSPKLAILILAGVSMYTILPFINFLSAMNAHLALPDSMSGVMQWMKDKQSQADEIMNAFLSVKSFGGLALNLFVVALMPAIGEELVFRGVIQRHLQGWTKSGHVAVWITAILFSAVHLEFFGFLPRFVLGLMLGYLYLYTRNLWVPIFAHFVNNASSIIIYYLHYNGHIAVKMKDFGAMPGVFAVSFSLILSVWIYYFISRNPWAKAGKENDESQVGDVR